MGFIEDYFSGRKNGFFIEAGALDGLKGSKCLNLERLSGWKGINVEPNEKCYERLVITRPTSINIRCGLSYYNGYDLLRVPLINNKIMGDYNGIASFIPDKEYGPLSLYYAHVITYDTLISKTGVSKLDLVVLDIEGNEVPVLSIIDKDHSVLPEMFCVEHEHSDKAKLEFIMEELGYSKKHESDSDFYYTKEGP